MNVPTFFAQPVSFNSQVRFLADENFDNRIVRAVLRHHPDLEIERVQDTAILGADDDTVLDWAAVHGQVVLSHDVATMIAHARSRVRALKPMAGLIVVTLNKQIGPAITDLLIVAGAATMADFKGEIVFLPL